MSIDDWSRPLFTPGGDDPFVFLVAFGPDIDELAVSQLDHRVDHVPESIDLAVQDADTLRAFFEPPIGDLLREEQPELVDTAAAAESCLVMRGSVDDPADLTYLRSVIGIATAALDAGAVAIYNLQSFALLSPTRWREEIFGPDKPSSSDFVIIVSSENVEDEPTGELWLHTRGMRLFGRPDLSLHGVPADQMAVGGKLLRALIDQQMFGLQIEDGSVMDVGERIGEISFRRRGHVDDPEFNNVHLEIDWPT